MVPEPELCIIELAIGLFNMVGGVFNRFAITNNVSTSKNRALATNMVSFQWRNRWFQDAIERKNTDDAVFYYNILRDRYVSSVGLDALIERLSDMSTPEVNDNVSHVAVVAEVRERVVAWLRSVQYRVDV